MTGEVSDCMPPDEQGLVSLKQHIKRIHGCILLKIKLEESKHGVSQFRTDWGQGQHVLPPEPIETLVGVLELGSCPPRVGCLGKPINVFQHVPLSDHVRRFPSH